MGHTFQAKNSSTNGNFKLKIVFKIKKSNCNIGKTQTHIAPSFLAFFSTDFVQ